MIRRAGWTGTAGVHFAAAVLLSSAAAGPAAAQDAGETLFGEICVACHSPGVERVVGPGLAGVVDRREHDWLVRKITEPDRLHGEGDPVTLELVEQHGMAMPNPGLTRGQAENVIAYLAGLDAGASGRADDERGEVGFTEAQARLGRALFQGRRRLEGGGASCNSCHDVTRQGVVGGGSLAVDLTAVYGRLGPGAVEAILRNPPFPVMKQAYTGRPPNDEEVTALLAFLRETDADSAAATSPAYGLLLAGAGILGSFLLAGLFTLAWRGRRRGPVNRKIFERQLRSR